MKYDCLVIGAGLSGCTAARLLAEAGKKVLVIEKGRDIAGNCHDYLSEAGITVHTHGPHIFHTVYKEVWDFLSKFTEFRLFQHRVLSYVHGMTVPFPINRDTLNAVFGENISTQDVQDFLRNEVKNSDFNVPSENFQDAVVCQVGERLYELFFTSPANNNSPKSVQPFASNSLHAVYIAKICPFASHAPRPSITSFFTVGLMYGGTVSIWVQKTTLGVPQEKRRLRVPSPTSIACLEGASRCSRSHSATVRSFPEVESMLSRV